MENDINIEYNIKKASEDFKNAKIDQNNYELYLSKFQEFIKIQYSHFDKYVSNIKRIKVELKRLESEEKDLTQTKDYVRLEYFQLYKQSHDYYATFVSELIIMQETTKDMLLKIANLITSMKVLDIEKDVLKRLNELVKMNNEFYKDVIMKNLNNFIEHSDDKMNKMVSVFIDVIKDVNNSNNENTRKITDIIVDKTQIGFKEIIEKIDLSTTNKTAYITEKNKEIGDFSSKIKSYKQEEETKEEQKPTLLESEINTTDESDEDEFDLQKQFDEVSE